VHPGRIEVSLAKWVALLIGWGAALFAMLRYIGQFSVVQSVILAIAGVVLVDHLRTLGAEEPRSKPFVVMVSPNWYELLHDNGLVKDAEEWKRIEAELKELPSSEYHVLRDGICFTVLKHRQGDASLIYLYQHFETEVDFCLPLAQIGERPDSEGCPTTPGLFISWDVREYKLGIAMSCLRGRFGSEGRNERITLAKVSYREFGYFYGYDWRQLPKLRRELDSERKRQLEENGWKEEERDWPDSGRHHYTDLHHKYFWVRHYNI
jgi:hypothetical protein